jgi:predicted DNA-binding transcriptional regulator YafY
MKLYNVLKNIIVEVSFDQVTNSIKNRNVVTIYYDGEEDGGKGLRTIEPYCVGTSKAGNQVLRAWDMEGASHTAKTGEQPLPGWRLFRLDRIGNYSADPRQTFDSARPLYNPDDKGMKGIKVCAKFETEKI